jgi:hypothetical protein
MIRRFEDVANACPTPSVRTAARVDPYYTAFTDSSQARWLNVDLARRQEDAGLGRLPAHLAMPAEEAWRRITNPTTLHRRLNPLAVLDSYRTATGQQIAAITGDASLASPRSEIMRELFAAGLVDVATLDTGMLTGPAREQVHLYRPARNNAFESRLAPMLSYPEWVSVTAGTPYDSAGQSDRHNALATDFCVRAAEFVELGSMVGEKTSRWDLLTVGSGPAPLHGWQARHADATILRSDGMKVALELTASVSESFRAKVRRYAELFNARPIQQNGLVVLFLVAAPLGNRRREILSSPQDRSSQQQGPPRHVLLANCGQDLRRLVGRLLPLPRACGQPILLTHCDEAERTRRLPLGRGRRPRHHRHTVRTAGLGSARRHQEPFRTQGDTALAANREAAEAVAPRDQEARVHRYPGRSTITS